ncbi:MAG: hypothetical protein RR569_06765 [Acinetobacter sp.]
MNTLTIPEIFSNFSYYQENYLSILQNPEQYHIEVKHAELNVWPIAYKKIWLGDLLQLWFSEKWLADSTYQLNLENQSSNTQQSSQTQADLFLFQLTGNAFTGKNQAKAWSFSEQKIISLSVNSVFKNLCYYESIDRPRFNQQLVSSTFKTAI